MTNYAMCPDEDCPSSRVCFRNPHSGTEPSDYQVWSCFKHDETGKCENFMLKWHKKPAQRKPGG